MQAGRGCVLPAGRLAEDWGGRGPGPRAGHPCAFWGSGPRAVPVACGQPCGAERTAPGRSPWQLPANFPPCLSNLLQLPAPLLRLRTDQRPPCRPCAPRAPCPACPPPASGPTPRCPLSTSTSPQRRPPPRPRAPGQPSRSRQPRRPSPLPTSPPPTSTGRPEGAPSAACLRPAPPTWAASQTRRGMRR